MSSYLKLLYPGMHIKRWLVLILLGVTLISEILPVAGVALGGELPSNIMPPTVIHAFLVSGAKNAETAKAFLDFLHSPEASRIIEAKGMKPGPR